ncbi:unnamed protein product [Anisakis simplex]|uniref:Methyl-accepting chemotaxis protein n=1 Tax=Anisakis simplex TaxID=6269 RepID=A0A0M3JP64_ANISI|nr:unnamed protein product [Anisakis simplex]
MLTFTTFELVKKDLSELGDVVANEASAIASSTVESVKHQAQSLQQIVSPVEEQAVLPGEVDGQRAEIVEKVTHFLLGT